MGLSKKAFGCIEESVLEYNRLRTNAGMSPYAEWNTALQVQHAVLQVIIMKKKFRQVLNFCHSIELYYFR